ncbi:Uncharacterised protein [Aeromonas hydrophila]|nr:Uncharacterised protein [Aeromonas hydrophila]
MAHLIDTTAHTLGMALTISYSYNNPSISDYTLPEWIGPSSRAT